MFYSGQRMVENFFKRARLRRSKRLRTSFRSPMISSQSDCTPLKEETQCTTSLPGEQSSTPVERQSSVRKSQRWRQSFARRSQRSKGQQEIIIAEVDPQMPILSSNPNKLRPRTADVHKLDMEANDCVELLAYKNDEKERISTDSKMVELLKGEVANLRKQLKKQEETVACMQAREEALQLRLSEQARKQLEKCSTKFEDLNLGVNRPTQLIERYGNLYSEGRVDALDALEELPEIGECDDLKNKLLLSIIVLSFRSAQKSLMDVKARLKELLHIPRVLQSGQPALCSAAKDLEEEVGLYLRKTVEKHDLSKNYNEVSEKVWSTLFDYPSLRECKGLKKYIAECVATSWALTIQNPPLVINFEPGDFNEDRHTRFHTSDSDLTSIKSFLWPALMEGDKGFCVSKGIVIT